MHYSLDVFHHHNGVIHQQPDGKYHGEQRQGVDRIAKQREHPKGAEQNDGYRQCRDQRGTNILHKQIHHHDHQHDGFDQRFDHVLNGDFDEVSAVFRIRHVIAFRHVALVFGNGIFDQCGRIKGIGTGCQHHGDACCRMAVQL